MTTNEVDLIPVRALNQVSYCQRLYYLEYVEALMQNNEHVEDGLFKHRRVNDPDLENRPRKEKDALHTRSVSLSSERLGPTAKLGMVEEKDGDVYPVEYKRGGGGGTAKPRGCGATSGRRGHARGGVRGGRRTRGAGVGFIACISSHPPPGAPSEGDHATNSAGSSVATLRTRGNKRSGSGGTAGF